MTPVPLGQSGTFDGAPQTAEKYLNRGSYWWSLAAVCALCVEDLNPRVVAVGHVEPVSGTGGDGMRQGELSRPGYLFAPRFDKAALLVEVDHTPVAVQVGPEC